MQSSILILMLIACCQFALADMSHSTASTSIKTITLDGHQLTTKQVMAIADGAYVHVDNATLERVNKSFRLLKEAAKQGHKIYGFTQGVGLNKDQNIFAGDEITPAARKHLLEFNKSLLYSHSAGVGPDMPIHLVRAIMATRLNSILYSTTGAQRAVAQMYIDFLNKEITPVVPSRGSIGQADITVLGHIGLAMLGYGEVFYKKPDNGHIIRGSASTALTANALSPLEPIAKDGLAIISSNAYSESLAVMAIETAKHQFEVAKLVFALSLEALNGNVAPLLPDANSVRPYQYVNEVSKEIRELLAGSYLQQIDDKEKTCQCQKADNRQCEEGQTCACQCVVLERRALQDSLSYRTIAYQLGTYKRLLVQAEQLLNIQLNSSDDNPAVVLDVRPPSPSYPQEERYYVVAEDDPMLFGAVIPTANFSPLAWVIEFEALGIAIAYFSNASAERIIKLSDPHFTKLSRFLGTDQTFNAYGAIQIAFVALNAENRALANPVSIDTNAIVGNIEDVATNAPLVMQRVRKMIDNTYYILGLELMHAAQAIDLRLQHNPDLRLSPITKAFYAAFRKKVAFLAEDNHILTDDIQSAYEFLRQY